MSSRGVRVPEVGAATGTRRGRWQTAIESVAPYLNERATPRTWRTVLAAAACLLAVVIGLGGLFRVVPWLQVGVMAGIMAGLVAGSYLSGALVSLASTAAGFLLAPANPFLSAAETAQPRTLLGLGAVLVAVTFAALTRLVITKWRRAAWVLCWLAVAMALGNLWLNTVTLNATPTFNPDVQALDPSLNDQIEGSAPTSLRGRDDALFMSVAHDLAEGRPYYASFRARFIEWGGRAPSSVTNVRFPLIFYLWSLAPGSSVVIVFLGLVTLTICSVVLMGSSFVRAPLTVPAAMALAAYFLCFSVQLILFTPEVWAVCAALFAVVLHARSTNASRWKYWTVGAVIAAVLAVLVRESLVFVPVAGLVSAWFVRDEQKGFRVVAWSAGIVLAGSLLAGHYWLTRSIVDAASTYSQFRPGGVDNVVAAFRYGTIFLGNGQVLALVLAAIGLLGVLVTPQPRVRHFLAVATVAPLASFLFLRNTGSNLLTSEAINYWGAGVVPFLYTALPLAFVLVPGAARGVSLLAAPSAQGKSVRSGAGNAKGA